MPTGGRTQASPRRDFHDTADAPALFPGWRGAHHLGIGLMPVTAHSGADHFAVIAGGLEHPLYRRRHAVGILLHGADERLVLPGAVELNGPRFAPALDQLAHSALGQQSELDGALQAPQQAHDAYLPVVVLHTAGELAGFSQVVEQKLRPNATRY